MFIKKVPAGVSFLATVYIALVLALFMSCADLTLGRWQLAPIPPTSGALVFLGPVIALVFVQDVLTSARPGSYILGLLRGNLPAVLAYGGIVFSNLVLSALPGAYWLEKGKWIFLGCYGFFILCFAMIIPYFNLIERRFHYFTFLGMAVLTGSMIYELSYPGTFSTVLSRAAGFAGNSNFGALSVVLLCAATLRYQYSKVRFDLFTLMIAGLGVFSTMSRSGLMNYVLLLALYSKLVFFEKGQGLRRGVYFLVGAGVFIGFFALTIPFLVQNSSLFQSQRTRFSSFESSDQIDDGSADSRKRAALDSLRLINEAPILGHGTGFSRTMEELPHNIYLSQWVNNGLPGLGSYLLFLAGSFYLFTKRKFRQGQVLAACVFFGGFFSHNILDQRPFLLTFGAMLGISWKQAQRSREAASEFILVSREAAIPSLPSASQTSYSA